MKIDLQGFLGKIPLAADHLLPEAAATIAKNMTVKRGMIEPLMGPEPVTASLKTGTVLSIYKFQDFWFNWLTDVDCVQGPIPGDTEERTYFTGDGAPKMTKAGLATSGADYPTASYLLGIPAPANPATATVVGTASPSPPDDGTEETRTYVYTYVSADGEEGAQSYFSTPVTWSPGQTVNLEMDGVPTGAYNITKKRIYRELTTEDGTFYFLVDEIAVGSGVSGSPYDDAVDSSDLVTTLSTDTYDTPPDDMHGLCAMAGGFMAGFSGNRVCFCVKYQPHAWPVGYRLAVDGDIIGGGVFGNSLLAVTKKNTYVFSGDSPDSMSQERLELSQSCVSKRGIADMGDAIVYPSPDGLMFVGVSGIENITRKLLTREQWQGYKPESLLGVAHDGRYYGFYDTGTVQAGFVIDFSTGSLVDIDLYATAAYTDRLTDTMYLVIGGELKAFGKSSTPLLATWKSKKVMLPKNASVGVGQVFASGYPVDISVVIDGVTHDSVSVQDEEPFFFNAGGVGRTFSLSVLTDTAIERVSVASTMRELR